MVRSIELREYQREAVDAVFAEFAQGKRRTLLIAATGAGKTITFSAIFSDILDPASPRHHPGGILLLAHRTELLEQARDKFAMVAGERFTTGLVQAASDDLDADLTIASTQTLAQDHRLERLLDRRSFALVCVDEAHHVESATMRRILERLGCFRDDGPLLLGVTATPDRGDGIALGNTYQSIAYSVGIEELVRDGYLVPPVGREIVFEGDRSLLKVNDEGEITGSSASLWFTSGEGPKAVAKAILDHAQDRTRIVGFMPGVEAAHATAEACREAGIEAAAVDGSMGARERKATLSDFGAGRLRLLTNADLLIEGWDEPAVDAIVLARPTRSRALFAQAAGRGLRPYPGKDDCLLLDLAGNLRAHSLVAIPALFGRERQEEAGAAKSSGHGPAQGKDTAVPDFGAVAGTREVNLFEYRRRTRIAWLHLPMPDGSLVWVLPVKDGPIMLKPSRKHIDRWSAVLVGKREELLADGVTLELAMGVAEEWARRQESGALVKSDAKWRDTYPTPGQFDYLMKLGISVRPRTRGEASDLIALAKARRAVSRW